MFLKNKLILMTFGRNIAGLALIWILATWCQKSPSPVENLDEKLQSEKIEAEVKASMAEIMSANNSTVEVTTETIENQKIAKIKIKDIKWTPLDMSWIYEKNDLQQFFWPNQYEVIFEKYNQNVVKKDKDWCIITDKSHYSDAELSFPRVHDSLVEFFPATISWFIAKYPEFKKDTWTSQTAIIVKKLENSKFALWYYKGWELFLATHVSPGKVSWAKNKIKKNKITWEKYEISIPWWDNTIEWIYRINKSEWFKFKRSNKFESSPMPFSIQISWWFFLHHGTNADWIKRSHWCVRVPWLYQRELYDNVESGTLIVIKWTKR